MDINVSAFKEPRGVMRVLHFIFSICAFATITGFTGYITLSKCGDQKLEYSYPFGQPISANIQNCSLNINMSFSSDAKFFVATGVLAMLYAIAISVIYAKYEEMYKSNSQLPLVVVNNE